MVLVKIKKAKTGNRFKNPKLAKQNVVHLPFFVFLTQKKFISGRRSKMQFNGDQNLIYPFSLTAKCVPFLKKAKKSMELYLLSSL